MTTTTTTTATTTTTTTTTTAGGNVVGTESPSCDLVSSLKSRLEGV